MITLAIDAMGGDNGINSTVPAAVEILESRADVALVLLGDEAQIKSRLDEHGWKSGSRLEIRHTTEIVGKDESPAHALRRKKHSSMRVAINLIKEGQVDAAVSAGNTGALMATARFVLKTIPGIDRPAICAALPRADGHTYMLDLGANVDVPPEILLQFGVMGSQLVECLDEKPNPTVGLLNIGVEDIKGNDTIRAAAELLKASRLNYIGFVEANEIYVGNTDLIVCDGVLGNVALKASEGVAQMIVGVMKEEFTRNVLAKGSALVAQPILRAIRNRIDHRRYNGASLLGLTGTVVKSHGSVDSLGFRHAIEVAIEEAQVDLVSQIQLAVEKYQIAGLANAGESS